MSYIPSSYDDFDLSKADVEGTRKRLRKTLILKSLAPVIIVFIISAKLTSLALINSLAESDYNSANYTSAIATFKVLSFANVIESYKAPFNIGTSQLRDRNFPEAESSLGDALTTAPLDHECSVRVNLTIAYLAHANDQTSKADYADAILLYDQAKTTVEARDCGLKLDKVSDTTREADQRLQELMKEIVEKQNTAKQLSNGDTPVEDPTNTGDDPSSGSAQSSPDDGQIIEIERQQAASQNQARKEASKNAQKEASASSNHRDKAKNW